MEMIMDELKTDYPDDLIMFPMTLEDLALLSVHFPGQGWDAMILRAKVLLAEKQAEIQARSLKP